MTVIKPLLDRNRVFAESGAHRGLAMMPQQRAFLITCLDPRVDPAAFLGVHLGDAAIVRNAGGRITDEVINDVAFISYLAEHAVAEGPLFEVAVIHHTECGTGALADPGFRRGFVERTGLDDHALTGEAVVDPEETVRADVARLLSSPRVSPRITVSGHVYDVVTGLVTSTQAASSPNTSPSSTSSGTRAGLVA